MFIYWRREVVSDQLQIPKRALDLQCFFGLEAQVICFLPIMASSMLRTSANKLVPNNFLKSFVFQRSDLLSDFKS